MGQELIGDLGFLLAPRAAHLGLALLGHQGLKTVQELLHLDRVIGERFGGGVDGGQAAADNGDGHTHL